MRNVIRVLGLVWLGIGIAGCGQGWFGFVEPGYEQLSPPGALEVWLELPAHARPETLEVTLDGIDVTSQLLVVEDHAEGTLSGVGVGRHELEATLLVSFRTWRGEKEWPRRTLRHFETVALQNADECEILNDTACLLPYPSSRFLVEAETPTGYRLDIPAAGLPQVNGPPVPPDPYNQLDGFAPTVQILMHFPAGVDLDASNAPRLLPPGCCGQPAGPPWIDTRTTDGRSREWDSPTLLIDAVTGERILHFIELDARAEGNPDRQVVFLRPGVSLVPGRRYIVAVRDLIDPLGNPVQPEAVFRTLRDRRPTTISAVEERRAPMNRLFRTLRRHGVPRRDLILAFDFVTQSEHQLTAQMLSMRDQSLAWVDEMWEGGVQTFDAPALGIEENDCSDPNQLVWRRVEGTYEVPLFLDAEPDPTALLEVQFLNVDEDGVPVMNGTTDAVFTITIPCSALDSGGDELLPIVIGHGLFQTGVEITDGLVPGLPLGAIELGVIDDWRYITGATDWRGLSGSSDLLWIGLSVIGVGESRLHNFKALPDRLKQGQLNTLVLAHMMKRGIFNQDPAFRTPWQTGVFPGEDEELFYYGISLGGIMGLMFSALTPDVDRLHVDVPAMNFAMMLQRSTQFDTFEAILQSIGITDPLDTALGLGLFHELWVSSEPAGYARHITRDPLPGTGRTGKKILMTPAWLDKQVSNQATEVAARTLRLLNLQGSVVQELQGIPDWDGPLDSAFVMYDAGSFDLFDAADQPFIPPLSNTIPSSECDPHSGRVRIPAALHQLFGFLKPGGTIENFCEGPGALCDGDRPFEIPGGEDQPCQLPVP